MRRQRRGLLYGVGGCIMLGLLSLGASAWAMPSEPTVYNIIQKSVQAGEHARTIDKARVFLRHFPQSTRRLRVRFWLAEALYVTQRYAEAVLAYQTLLQQQSTFPRASTTLYHLGSSAFFIHDYNVALEAFQELLERFPGYAGVGQVLARLATIYFEQGRFEDALPLYQQLLQAPKAPLSASELYLQLGHCALYLQQFEQAQQYYSRILQHAPHTSAAAQARYHLGVLALAQGHSPRAQEHFYTLARTHKALRGQAHRAVAWMLYRRGEIAQAATSLHRQGLLARSTPADVVLAQSYEHLLLQNYWDAAALLSKALTTVRDPERQQELRWLLARTYREAGADHKALQAYDDFMRHFPQSERAAEAGRLRGDILSRQRDTTKALTAYGKVVSSPRHSGQTAQALWAMAELFETQQRLPDAIVAWRRFLQEFPLSPQRVAVQRRLGILLLREGAVARAVMLYRSLVEGNLERPLRLQVQADLAWAYLKAGKHEKALQLWDELVQAAPGAALLRRARFWRAWILQRGQQYQQAQAEWEALLLLETTGERRGDILWRLGSALMAQKQYRKASTYLRQVVATSASVPYVRFARWQLQQCLMALERYEEALYASPAFVRQDPLSFFRVTEHFERGQQLFEQKHYAQAREAFAQIVAFPIRTLLTDDAEFLIAESYVVEGDTHHALEHYRRVTRQYGPSALTPLAFYRQALLLQEAGLASMAVPAFEAAELHTTDPALRYQVQYRLGKIYVDLQQRDNAVAVFRRLLRGETTDAAMPERMSIGLMLQQLKDYDATLLAFRQVLQQARTDPLRAEAQFWIAETHQLRGSMQEALSAYHEVATRFLQQHMWAVTALFRAGEIYETLQQYDKAIKMYKRVVAVGPNDKHGRYAAERVRVLTAKSAPPQRQGS